MLTIYSKSENFPVSHLFFSNFDWLSKANMLLNRKHISMEKHDHYYYFSHQNFRFIKDESNIFRK